MRHITFSLCLLGLGLFTSNASAGRIFGDIKLDGKAVPEGLPVKLTCAAPADEVTTDKFGSYKLMAKEEGKCSLTLTYQNQPVSLDVFSYKDATRYDLILEPKDGKFSLRRK